MKKITLILLSVLLSVGAWAETAIFCSAYMTGQNADADIVANNIWLGNGTDLSADFKIEINGNRQKGLTGQSTITVDATNYVAFKNSNGAQMTITLPEGKVATAVDFYVTTNDDNNLGKLSEIDGSSCSDVVSSVKNGANPTQISKTIAYKNSFTFTFNTAQVFFIAVVTYRAEEVVDPATVFTFGFTRPINGGTLEAEQKLTPACAAITTSDIITTYGKLNNRTLYHGDATAYTADGTYRNATASGNTLVKSQNGETDGAETLGAYVAFKLNIEPGYVLSLSNIATDLYVENKPSWFYEYIIEDKDGNSIYKSPAPMSVAAAQSGTDHSNSTELRMDEVKNLSGEVTVKFVYWINSGGTTLALKDFNVTASVKEIDPVDPALVKTFGAERANDATVYTKIDPAVTGITVGDLTSTYMANGAGDVYHGSETTVNFAAGFKNYANSKAIKTQNGEEFGAETNNAAIYFDLTAAAGYKMRITNIASDWYVGAKDKPFFYEYIIEDAHGNVLYKSPEPLSVKRTTPSEYFDYSVNLKAVETLKNLTGAIRVKFLWWVDSGSTNIALKNLKVQAVIEEPDPEPESTWRDIKMDFTTESSFIREVTTTRWDLFTTGIAVAEDGTVSAVETTAENSVGTLNAKYVDAQWGLSVPTFTVAVEGPVKISLGSSYYAGTITIKKNGETLTSFNSYVGEVSTKLWSQSNPDCVSYLYLGEAATLTIISSSYCPYIAVEKFDLLTEDVKIDFRTDPYTVILPTAGELPAGVTVEFLRFNDAQHGIVNGKMHVNVAGPTKFTIGGCQFNNNNAVIKDASGNTLTTLDTKAAGCDNGFGTYSHFATYCYTGGAQELVIDLGSYCPYIFVEKIAVVDDQMTAEAMEALDEFTGAVTINRSLTAGMFNTICLPFAMTAAEINAKLGTCDIRELSTATLNDNVLVLDFAPATAIEAGKPYLIQPTAAISSWTMENVTLSTTTNPSITASVDFIGVLTPAELTASENTLCVGANDRLFYVGATSTMKGLRAYFQVKGAAAGAPARISLGGHVATGLENDNDNANVNKLIEQGRVIIRIDGHDYDLNGRLLK